MSEITEQAILTLSKEIQLAAAHAVGSAHFARFYRGQIIKQLGDRLYRVAVDDCLVEMPVYGDVEFQAGERCWIISPDNSKELNRMFILGVSGPNGQGSTADHKILMKFVKECDDKLSKGAVVQIMGESTHNVMSQKAVTDLIKELQNEPKSIQQIILGDRKLIPDDNGSVTIPIANSSLVGAVKSSNEQNHIQVATDGTMSIQSLDVMRVDQASDNTLVLDGGRASTW